MKRPHMPLWLGLPLVLVAAAGAAALAARLLSGVDEPGPGPKLDRAAREVRAYYAGRPQAAGWRITRVAAWPRAVRVHIRLPGADVAGLLQSPMGFQQAMLARACPPAEAPPWRYLAADEDIRLAGEDRHGETFLTVSCRAFRG